MTVLLPTLLFLLAPPTAPEGPQSAAPAATEESVSPVSPTERDTIPTSEAELPFAAESLPLSDVLRLSLEENIDLRNRVVDVSISETAILSALGAFDVQLTSGLSTDLNKSVPRGSQFVFTTGSRSVAGYLGFARKLETGGNISLRFDLNRRTTDQPISFANPAAGSAELAEYRITPTLQLTHPLLKGLGIKVNRAAIDRAKLARSQSEAVQLTTAQNMVRDIVSAYWDVLYAKRDLENKHHSLELAREQLARTQAQVAAGRLAPVEAKAVEQSQATRESEVLLAENTLLDQSLNLRTLMGQEFAGRKQLGVLPETNPENIRPEAIDLQNEIERAMAANPEIRRLELALSSKRIDELEAANQRLPQLNFTGSFTPQGRSVDTLPNEQTGEAGSQGSWGEAFRNFFNDDIQRDGLLADYTVSAALDLTWDIQNRVARGNHQRIQLEMRQAESSLKQMRQTVSASVIRATNSLRTASKRVQVAELSVELAQQNLDAEQARFDVGRSTNYDVLSRIDELTKAEAEALRAQTDYLKALVQLQALNGDILPAYGLEIPSRAEG